MLQNFPEDFSYILGLHEGSVVAMAVGFSFMQDKPAIVNLHTTAGVGNAMGAIVTRGTRSPDHNNCWSAGSQADFHGAAFLGEAGRLCKAVFEVERRAASLDRYP